MSFWPSLAGLVSSLLLCTSACAVELTGLWRHQDDEDGQSSALIRISALADGSFEGVIERYFPAAGATSNPLCERCPGELRNRPIVGMKILSALRRKGARLFDDGEILDPEDGKTYRCRMEIAPDARTLDVTGYIGISLLGRTERWTREE
jgi:hypothetical protein